MSRPPRLTLCPINLRDAMLFVARHHRHHRAPQGGLFAVACALTGSAEPCGVAIVGRSRAAGDNGRRQCVLVPVWCELARRAGAGLPPADYLHARVRGGGSLRGAGWALIGECGGGSWSREDRPRVDRHPTQTKFRWEKITHD